jgi:hypothetical protein
MYTPEDITVSVPDPTDRPYAGWLYLGVSFHNKTDRWFDIIEFNVGMIGPASIAGDTQRFVHHTLNIQEPEGWAHQVGNEPAINLIWERKVRLWRAGSAFGPGADAFAHWGASLGTLYTYANGGGLVRAGWNVPTDFGVSTIRLAGDINAPMAANDPRLRAKRSWGLNVFGGFEGRAVLRDGTLDGNLFSDSASVDKYPFVADLSIGASLIVDRWKFSYSQVARSREFKGQKHDWHSFGSVNVALTF